MKKRERMVYMGECIYNTNGFCYKKNSECPFIGNEQNCEEAEES